MERNAFHALRPIPEQARNGSPPQSFLPARPAHFLDSSSTQGHEVEITLRLLLAALCGAGIGFERKMQNRSAGLRTHMLTAMAAAVFTILTFEIFHATRAFDNKLSLDPIRVIEAVTAGVAFLAAGTIIQSRGKVEGLTTGAGHVARGGGRRRLQRGLLPARPDRRGAGDVDSGRLALC